LTNVSSKPAAVIKALSVTKYYGKRLVVDGFSVEIEQGQIFGLLGPNAAGKTTAIRMLCGIIDKDEGEVLINGTTIADAKSRIGYVSQCFGQYEELTVWENLKFYAEMYNVKDEALLEKLLKRYALEPFKDQRAGSLSGGYQRRLALVCAVAHDPDVLFLDEPTAGIDPVTRKLLWDEFYELSARGKTLFVTTHYMEEAQRCHQLAFIDSGKIIARGTPVTIKQSLGEVVVYAANLAFNPDVHNALLANDAVLLVNQFGTELRIVVAKDYSRSQLEQVILNETGERLPLVPGDLNLEDVFIALTQHRKPDRC
jgi:ABC-type multidrug transport system ATPase subunit